MKTLPQAGHWATTTAPFGGQTGINTTDQYEVSRNNFTAAWFTKHGRYSKGLFFCLVLDGWNGVCKLKRVYNFKFSYWQMAYLGNIFHKTGENYDTKKIPWNLFFFSNSTFFSHFHAHCQCFILFYMVIRYPRYKTLI